MRSLCGKQSVEQGPAVKPIVIAQTEAGGAFTHSWYKDNNGTAVRLWHTERPVPGTGTRPEQATTRASAPITRPRQRDASVCARAGARGATQRRGRARLGRWTAQDDKLWGLCAEYLPISAIFCPRGNGLSRRTPSGREIARKPKLRSRRFEWALAGFDGRACCVRLHARCGVDSGANTPTTEMGSLPTRVRGGEGCGVRRTQAGSLDLRCAVDLHTCREAGAPQSEVKTEDPESSSQNTHRE